MLEINQLYTCDYTFFIVPDNGFRIENPIFSGEIFLILELGPKRKEDYTLRGVKLLHKNKIGWTYITGTEEEMCFTAVDT